MRAIATRRRLAVAESQVAVPTENLRVARDRVMVGANSPIDAERAELQHLASQTELEQARTATEAARSAPERYLGRPLIDTLDTAWFDRAGGYGPAVQPRDRKSTHLTSSP